jgi:hypothetical protein
VYAKQNIYSLPTTLVMFRQYKLDGFLDKDKNHLPRTDAIFILGVDIVHYFDRNRAEAEKDPTAESGTFDTSFSTSPSDYSLWDCYKTGTGSPAIACQLTRQADAKARDSINKKELAIAVDDRLLNLTSEALTKICGSPRQTGQEPSQTVLDYPSSRQGIPLKFRFGSLTTPPGLLQTVETEDAKGPDGRYPREHVYWYRGYDSLSDASRVAQELACLK